MRLCVLIVEGAENEAGALASALRGEGYEPEYVRVDTAGALRDALRERRWDAILAADLPGLGIRQALTLLGESGHDIPFLAVVEPMAEEQVAELMREGAQDVVPRRALDRLAPAVRREMGRAEERRRARPAEEKRRESEARFRRIVETASEGIWELGEGERTTYVNQQMADMLGYTRDEMIGRPLFDFMDEVDFAYAQECIARREPGSTHRDEFHFRRKDGGDLWALVGTQPVLDAGGRLVGALGMLTDITARKRIEQERQELLGRERAAREAAEDARAARDRFLALLSHELRNPLAPVLAGMSVLRRALPENSRARRTLDIMERNVQVQARLVTDLLELSSIVRGQVPVVREPLRLETAVRAAVDAHKEDADGAGLTLDCRLDPDLWVCGDAARLQRAVESLITNAIRFTPGRGSVRVDLHACEGTGGRPAGEAACVVVEDTGKGISPEVMPRLFDMFQRGETGGWERPGLGIGLALVKSIAEAHGGQTRAESEGNGKGSRFTIELPLTVPSAGEASVEQAGPPAEERSILLVGGDADSRVLLSDGLELLGLRPRTAESGEVALEMIRRDRPKALLVDVSAPEADGDFMRRARELPAMDGVPAFAITDYGSEDADRYSREGFDGQFAKPVDVRALKERIRELSP